MSFAGNLGFTGLVRVLLAEGAQPGPEIIHRMNDLCKNFQSHNGRLLYEKLRDLIIAFQGITLHSNDSVYKCELFQLVILYADQADTSQSEKEKSCISSTKSLPTFLYKKIIKQLTMPFCLQRFLAVKN